MDLNGNIKIKNLQECKDEVARKHGHATFSRVRFAGTEAQLKILDEAAELYAGQTKQSEPVSEDVDTAFEDFWNFAYSEHGLTTSDPEFDTIDYETCGKIFKAGFLANKSKQPASVAFLSEDEIKEMFPISGEKQDSFWQTSRREGARHIQTELRKRVNAADPDQVLNDVLNGFVSGKYKRPTDSNSIAQFVIDYLKTK